MKKFISAAIAALLMVTSSVSIATTSVNAETVESEVMPRYSYTQSIGSYLSISNKVASMRSSVYGSSSVTKIMVTQYLQKKVGSDWAKVGEGKVKTFYATYANYSNTSSTLYSGTYRVKTVAQVYSGSSYETITSYSTTMTC